MEEKVLFHGEPIEVGDKVWDIVLYGYRDVISINPNQQYQPITLYGGFSVYENGKHHINDLYPRFFWSPPEIIPPKKPKKKVVRKEIIEIDRWGTPDNRSVYPIEKGYDFDWKNLLNKPPMTMTLEWEEEV
jgi:hypothetical protein